MIIDYLKKYKSITPLEAIRDFGVYRLSARIKDLKDRYGYKIKSEMIAVETRNGGKTYVAKYSFDDGKECEGV
jgi:hypothetical protein